MIVNAGGEKMKKVLLMAIVAAGLAFASAPRADAGVSIGIGIGIPVGYGYGYGGYGYRYRHCSPYYGYARPYPYYRVGYRSGYRGRPYYWRNGRRVHYARQYYRR